MVGLYSHIGEGAWDVLDSNHFPTREVLDDQQLQLQQNGKYCQAALMAMDLKWHNWYPRLSMFHWENSME